MTSNRQLVTVAAFAAILVSAVVVGCGNKDEVSDVSPTASKPAPPPTTNPNKPQLSDAPINAASGKGAATGPATGG